MVLYVNQFYKDANDDKYMLLLKPQRVGQGRNNNFYPNCKGSLSTTTQKFMCKMRAQYNSALKELNHLRALVESSAYRFRATIDQLSATEPEQAEHTRHVRSIHNYLGNHQLFRALPLYEQKYVICMLLTLQTIHTGPEYLVATHDHLLRQKRFDLFSIFLGWQSYANAKAIEEIKGNINILRDNLNLAHEHIERLAEHLNTTITVVNRNTDAIIDLNLKLQALNVTIQKLVTGLWSLQITSSLLGDMRTGLAQIRTGLLMLHNNVQQVEEILRVIATHKANPLFLPPNKLQELLIKVQDHIRDHTRLELPKDPHQDIWQYYQFISLNAIVLDDCLILIISIPLLDNTMHVDLYRAYSLPALHPDLNVEYTYDLENPYVGITDTGIFAILPSTEEVQLCKASAGYYCYFKQALYPTKNNNWCIYALFTDNKTAIEQYCPVKIKPRYHAEAINIDGYWWAISAFHQDVLHIRCLDGNDVIHIEPPLQLIEMANGCEGYSPTIFIPPRNDITMDASHLNYTFGILQYNVQYQNISAYHFWTYMEMTKVSDLPDSYKQQIRDQLTSLPSMPLESFKRNYKALNKYSFSMPSFIILAFCIVSTLVFVCIIVIVVWQVRRAKRLTKVVKAKKYKHVKPLLSQITKFQQKEMEERIPLPAITHSTTRDEVYPSKSSASPPPIPKRPMPKRTKINKPIIPPNKLQKPITASIFRKAARDLVKEGYQCNP